MSKIELIDSILTARYENKIDPFYEKYIKYYGFSNEFIKLFKLKLDKNFSNTNRFWNGYDPDVRLKVNNKLFKSYLSHIISTAKFASLNSDKFLKFLHSNHLFIKFAIAKWILASPGLAIENYIIKNDTVPKNVMKELNKNNLFINDNVICIHIISNKEREMLNNIGYNIPDIHWIKSYFIEALIKINSLIKTNSKCKGMFCMDSWVFDPDIHKIASDGKPYAFFSFLKDDKFIGNRYFVDYAKPDNEYNNQLEFSILNERRRKLYEKGEFIPKTYCIFYPREELSKNIKRIKNEM